MSSLPNSRWPERSRQVKALEQLERDAVIERGSDGAYVVSAPDDPEDEEGLFKAALRRVHAGRKGSGEYGED